MGCVYIALYPAQETPPVFPLPPWYTPSPSLVVGPPQQQRLQPQPWRYLIALRQPGEEMHRIDTATTENKQPQQKYLIAP